MLKARQKESPAATGLSLKPPMSQRFPYTYSIPVEPHPQDSRDDFQAAVLREVDPRESLDEMDEGMGGERA